MQHLRVIPRNKIELTESILIEGEALNALHILPSNSVQCVITSPPYWGLRDYGIDGQIGLEDSMSQYINRLIEIFSEVKRVLKSDGTFWLNIGDGYTSGNRGWRAPDKKNPARAMNTRPNTPDGLKPKDLLGIPWRLAFALQKDGWYLRSDIIWNKPNGMPESVKDRPTRTHEYIFLFSKSEKYYYDNESIKEYSGSKKRNKRSVWNVKTQGFNGAHFATFPPELITPCIIAGSKENDYILDPFFGVGTIGVTGEMYNRNYIGIELNPEYVQLSLKRLQSSSNLKLVI